MRGAIGALLVRVRDRLEVPYRSDIAGMGTRLDRIEEQLAALEARRRKG